MTLRRLSCAWVDDVMQRAAASAPATAEDRRGGHATAVEPHGLAGQSLFTAGILGHQDRPPTLGALARHGQVASETDEHAAAAHCAAGRVSGSIRAHTLGSGSQIEAMPAGLLNSRPSSSMQAHPGAGVPTAGASGRLFRMDEKSRS